MDSRLDQLLPRETAIPERLHEAMRYSALAPGKRLRPALCMAASQAVKGKSLDALDAACGVELIHCFSLIHDDLPCIDDDALRRGRPTCHIVFGEAMAVLAGDALFALAFQVVAESEAPAERKDRVIRRLARAAGSGGLVGGEVLDVLSEGDVADENLLRVIHERKTGALISAACEIGGILGGGSMEEVAALKEFGEHVGLAFQITDDVLNETGDERMLGKAVGSDRVKQKQTYPAALGLEAAKDAAAGALQRAEDALSVLTGDLTPLRELAEYSAARTS